MLALMRRRVRPARRSQLSRKPAPFSSIAREGVTCTCAYVSAPLCSPSRSGLMTGRYQERFGSRASAHSGQNGLAR
jgi:arylsulfatase A-like enzyme